MTQRGMIAARRASAFLLAEVEAGFVFVSHRRSCRGKEADDYTCQNKPDRE
jgi:hypothetical protein